MRLLAEPMIEASGVRKSWLIDESSAERSVSLSALNSAVQPFEEKDEAEE